MTTSRQHQIDARVDSAMLRTEAQGHQWDRLLEHNPELEWQPSDERCPRYIGTFTPQHRIRLWRWITRRDRGIAFAVTWAWMEGPFAPRGDMACDDMERACDEIANNPREWLEETTFMQALAALIIGDGNSWVLLGRSGPPVKTEPAGPDWWDC